MKIAIMQPTYLPWVGYFDLIDQVDQFVFLDDVQLTKRSWQVRNRIKTPQGEFYLSLPIEKAPRATRLHQAKIKTTTPWQTNHLQNIDQHYRKSTYHGEVLPILQKALSFEGGSLVDLNIHIIKTLCESLAISAEFHRSSMLRSAAAAKGDGLIEVCHILQADAYHSPLGSAAYIEGSGSSEQFKRAGIHLSYQHYTPAPYPQLHGEFIPYLSVVDLVLNQGFAKGLATIRAGAKAALTPAKARVVLGI